MAEQKNSVIGSVLNYMVMSQGGLSANLDIDRFVHVRHDALYDFVNTL